jgi:hypothetical protein
VDHSSYQGSILVVHRKSGFWKIPKAGCELKSEGEKPNGRNSKEQDSSDQSRSFLAIKSHGDVLSEKYFSGGLVSEEYFRWASPTKRS